MHDAQQVPHVLLAFAPLIHKYGYIAVGGLVMLEDFGIPVPGETVLSAAAFYAGLGQLNIVLVIVIGILGAVIGDNIGYAIGRFGGHPLVERFGKYVFLTPERLNKTEVFFRKHGGKVVVVARFIEGLRQLNGIIAGVSEMPWPEFLLFNALGAVIWVTLWSVLGYVGGSHIATFIRYPVAVVVALLGFVAYRLLKRRIKSKNQTNQLPS